MENRSAEPARVRDGRGRVHLRIVEVETTEADVRRVRRRVRGYGYALRKRGDVYIVIDENRDLVLVEPSPLTTVERWLAEEAGR